MLNNPKLYEINTRVWLKRFGKNAKIKDIPHQVWTGLKEKGIDFIWLLGIWKTCTDNLDEGCFTPELIKQYNAGLKDWTKADVIGSPYAIDEYSVNPALGTQADLLDLKKELNSLGMALILDFVPNHFGSTSRVFQENPEIFLQVDREAWENEPYTYFTVQQHPGLFFSHGRDPFFPAWRDTAQLNYFNPLTRDFMAGTLQDISRLCDGVRCAMAMLVLNNVFGNTWSGAADKSKFPESSGEFWSAAINEIKSFDPGFIFIAETYWGLERDLQRLGFDYTSDKMLYDRLAKNGPTEIRGHLTADLTVQQKSIRYIEKYEEERALHVFGHDKSMAAATIAATIPGLMLYQDGQWEGRKLKQVMQLGREAKEPQHPKIEKFYEKLLAITLDRAFRDGVWELLFAHKAWDDNHTNSNLLAWKWKLAARNIIVVVNYSPVPSQCFLKFSFSTSDDKVLFNDVMNDNIYIRAVAELTDKGLYIDLPPWKSHILVFDEDFAGSGSFF